MVLSRTEPSPLEETRGTLVAAAHRRFGSIPAELIVDHVLRTAVGADFAVREAALDALRRRWEFALRDGLRIAGRPSTGGVLGVYTTMRVQAASGKREQGRAVRTKRTAREFRPYTSELESMEPLRASCDCADFLRSSLGICKHLLVVLEDVFSSRQRAKSAAAEVVVAPSGPRLGWEPELPLSGALDRLAGLRLEGRSSRRAPHSSTATAAFDAVQRMFPDGRPNPRLLERPARPSRAPYGARRRPCARASPPARRRRNGRCSRARSRGARASRAPLPKRGRGSARAIAPSLARAKALSLPA